MSAPLRVLVVCTGNISRSPFAAAALAEAGLELEVSSAGTHAVVGAGADPRMVERAGRLARNPAMSEHVARRLTERMVAESDLVVTMTREHRAAALSLEPRALRRTFTLPELADAVAEAARRNPGLGLAELLPEVPRYRSLCQDPDVPDPYGRADGDYDRAVDLVLRAVRRLTDALPPSA